MEKILLFNTLSRQVEEFKPVVPGQVGLYTCGPTVYNFAHIGNLRTYLFEDILKRVLTYNGLAVKHVMNITDVGHLTGDRDMGEDKMEAGAAREGKTAWEVAAFYTEAFQNDLRDLNIIFPEIWAKATDHISEQIDLIKTLEAKGYTYQIADGIYFDTSKIADYNKLSHLPLKDLKAGARVEKNADKKNPTDFALWKFSPTGSKRQMEWPSPWGVGFPGWHIECSAMSFKYLKDNLDIHCGGVDHINIHHTNEIAQSEAATGQKFFNYWLHGEFLNIAGGKKMAKSSGNFLTIANAFVKNNLSPLVYRFAALSVHYRKPMEYEVEIMKNAAQSLNHLRHQVSDLGLVVGQIDLNWRAKFLQALNNDLNMPQALSIVQEMLKSDLKNSDKLATVLDFDKVLGLNLEVEIPADIIQLATERDEARKLKDWDKADDLRKKIEARGYLVKDHGDTFAVMKQ